jgi:hypothetical protein
MEDSTNDEGATGTGYAKERLTKAVEEVRSALYLAEGWVRSGHASAEDLRKAREELGRLVAATSGGEEPKTGYTRAQPERGSADISLCGAYRYRLTRTWGAAAPMLFVMLNPSTADAGVDDPTIRRCRAFARSAQAGGIIVVNLFAFIATDPRALAAATDPIGPDNDALIQEAAIESKFVVVAWGASLPAAYPRRDEKVLDMLRQTGPVYCLGTTKDGHPRHPLYVRGDAPLIEYPIARRAS